ncbi:helix-turn-helix transcriptional regulator [Roseomonas populi]|uniref:LuxR C-terminal-related transcriptional regulator n=1 Tax=Roseomonas populi TaxID=3121582 RepID=A0ABT1WXY2_9PROT|nr:LuxR C-terminal-related transcriptional regulator [Roseomonas pecuniae]MCR0980697.1 LuxR C-terminal-related transcriptional regulator [Roseomonas pecuniae]
MESDLERVLGLVYEAALHHERWPDALDAISEFLGGEGGSLGVDHRHTQIAVSTGLGEEILSGYDPHWHRVNPLWPGVLAARTGAVAVDRHALDWSTYRRSEFYNDFVRARGGDGCLLVKALETEAVTAVVTIHRGRGRGDRAFGEEEAGRAALLAPHLMRAMEMSGRLGALHQAETLAAETLEHLPQAAFIVDAASRIIIANRRAEDLLRQADGLSHSPDGLRAARPAETAELRRQIAAAAAPDGASTLGRRATLLLERPSGRQALAALVGPFRSSTGWSLVLGIPAAAMVLVNDPETATLPAAEHLRRHFRLTPAEAALALAVAQGEGIPAVAEALNISPNTARTHLQHVYDKTGTHRQAELVRLLLTTFNGYHDHPG